MAMLKNVYHPPVVEAFKKALGCDIIVDENGHLMGALGIAILAGKGNKKKVFDFSVEDMVFKTREINCGRCPNNCEIICVYRDDIHGATDAIKVHSKRAHVPVSNSKKAFLFIGEMPFVYLEHLEVCPVY